MLLIVFDGWTITAIDSSPNGVAHRIEFSGRYKVMPTPIFSCAASANKADDDDSTTISNRVERVRDRSVIVLANIKVDAVTPTRTFSSGMGVGVAQAVIKTAAVKTAPTQSEVHLRGLLTQTPRRACPEHVEGRVLLCVAANLFACFI